MAGQCFAHGTQHIPQTTSGTCWAACIAMLVNHRDGSTYTDVDIARLAGIDVEVGCRDDQYPDLLRHWNLRQVYGSCMTPEGWEQLLYPCPTIVGVTGHVIVADGIDGDGTEDGTQIYVLDPLSSGPDYWSFQKIEQEFELRANREVHMIQY
jgi:ABC-type bacteriocin/lantibiotic exporter with double-glycine peptidase domain